MKPDPRIIQIRSASEACSNRTLKRWKKEEEMKKKAREIYGSDVSPLRFIIKSNGSVEYTPKKWWEFWK